MIVKNNKHNHLFKEQQTKVSLYRGKKTAIDILRQFICKCGKVETTDIIERQYR